MALPTTKMSILGKIRNFRQSDDVGFLTTIVLPLRHYKHVILDTHWLDGYQVWHLITGCHLCVGLIPISDNTDTLL